MQRLRGVGGHAIGVDPHTIERDTEVRLQRAPHGGGEWLSGAAAPQREIDRDAVVLDLAGVDRARCIVTGRGSAARHRAAWSGAGAPTRPRDRPRARWVRVGGARLETGGCASPRSSSA